MKRAVVGLLLILFAAFTLAADEAEVILQARNDATEDGQKSHAFWWGVGGVAIAVLPLATMGLYASAIPVEARRAIAFTAPPVAGMSLALVGFFTGTAEVPEARSARIQEEYGDSRLAKLYESEYEQMLSRIQRRKRGTWALIGSGAAVGAMGIGFLLVYLSN